ncbi:MAG: hypothetical protein IPO21_18405 [Bacteroidales bacterium]|nr:hypothetical protein [Bacteroidales bacterium]
MKSISKYLFLLAGCMFLSLGVLGQKIVFVNAKATGNNDGSTWENAYIHIQDAINNAANAGGGDVWVAAETYIPVSDRDGNFDVADKRTFCFVLRKNVRVYGGFVGSELKFSQRNHYKNVTILSGEIGLEGFDDNCYSIVCTDGNLTKSSILNGFTITGASSNANGGGALLTGGTIEYCTFISNYAANGAALHATNAVIRKCELKFNRATQNAGGAYLINSKLDSCTIRNNSAINGAGVYSENSTVSSSTVYENTASGNGGGLFITNNAKILSCKIFNNSALNGGGTYKNSNSIIVNTLLANNNADNKGGGIYTRESGNNAQLTIVNNYAENAGGALYSESACVIKNSVLWNNNKSIANENQQSQFSNIAISDIAPITGVVVNDLKLTETQIIFVKPIDSIGNLVTPNAKEVLFYANWQPAPYSPIVENGNNTFVDTILFDINGKTRILNTKTTSNDNDLIATVDLGAYESKANLKASESGIVYIKKSWTGNGDGTSWQNASDELQLAIDNAAKLVTDTVLQIWVERGLYYPANTMSVGLSVHKSVELYGGFVGWESQIDERDLEYNKTVLSADIGEPFVQEDNIKVVLSVSAASIIDGFSLIYGKDRGADINKSIMRNCEISFCGFEQTYAAISMINSSLINSSIHDNVSTTLGGGAIYAYNSTINRCKIFQNTNGGFAGGLELYSSVLSESQIYDNKCTGIMNYGGGGISVTNGVVEKCIIRNNSTNWTGGGISAYGDSFIKECEIYNNKSVQGGGGVSSTGSANVKVENCHVYNNISAASGGGLYSCREVVNSIIRNNEANDGGGIYNCKLVLFSTIIQNKTSLLGSGYTTTKADTLKYSILWGNTDNDNSSTIQLYQTGGQGSITYCGIEGGYTGIGNFSLSKKNGDNYGPNFTKPSSASGVSNEATDLTLLTKSPIIDRAIFDAKTPPVDYNFNCRVINGAPDFGAIESGESEYKNLILNRIYVTEYGTGLGTSWTDALGDINQAIFIASFLNISEVWVAKGVYYPNLVRDRHSPIILRSGVSVYGGFAGSERFLSQREFKNNATVISGDIGRINKNYDNSYCLVYYNKDKADKDSTLFDGFVLTNAYQNNEPDAFPYAFWGNSMVLKNCTFTNNVSTALFAQNMNIINCKFYNNAAVTANVMAPVYLSDSKVDSSLFYDNSGNYGGSCYAINSKIDHTTFYSNTSIFDGGGLFAKDCELVNITAFNNRSKQSGGGLALQSDKTSLTNALIFNNKATYGGGLSMDAVGKMLFLTIANNHADSAGGAIEYKASSPYNEINNSVLWGNKASKDKELYSTNGDLIPYDYIAIEDSITFHENAHAFILQPPNTGNDSISNYPFFVYPTPFIGNAETEDQFAALFYSDWELQFESALIDTAKLVDVTATDLKGRNRIIYCLKDTIAMPDMGALECKTKSPKVLEHSRILYISEQWKGCGDGSSWENARNDIQDAIDYFFKPEFVNKSNCEIWVSEGIYHPSADINGSRSPSDLREKSFVLSNGVSIYGGFKGYETTKEGRNIIENKTILSAYPLPYEHRYASYHVVFAPETAKTAVLEGFYITGGYASNFFSSFHQEGGGALMFAGDLVKCIFVNNRAINNGGAVVLHNESRLINSIVVQNTSYSNAGGVMMYDSSYVTLSTIVNNEAKLAHGGVSISKDATIDNSVIWNNIAPTSAQINDFENVSFSAIQFAENLSNQSILSLAKFNSGSSSDSLYPYFISPSLGVGAYNSNNYYQDIPSMNWNISSKSALINQAGGNNLDTIYYTIDSTDIFGIERPLSGKSDIGVAEFSNIPIVIEQPHDVNLCEGKNAVCLITATGENIHYQWQYRSDLTWIDLPESEQLNGVQSELLLIDSAGTELHGLTVRCKVYNNNGSSFSDNISFTVNPLPRIDIKEVVHLCEGEELAVYTPNLISLQWSTGDMGTSITPLQSGLYSITITDDKGCVNENKIQALLHKKPAAPFKESEIKACNGDFVWLEPGNFKIYNWNDGTSEPVYIATQPGLYVLKATDEFGCSVIDSVNVLMHENPIPEIKYVSYLKDGSGIFVIWNAVNDQALDNFKIYRGTVSSQQYNIVGSVKYGELPSFVDKTLPDNNERYSYSLRIYDSCLVASSYANTQTTILINAYRRTSNVSFVDLVWNLPSGMTAEKCKLFRGESLDKMIEFAETDGKTNYYETEAGNWKYFAVAVPMQEGYAINGENYTYLYSNFSPIRDFTLDPTIQDSANTTTLVLYPNPTNDVINCKIEGEDFSEAYTIRIFGENGALYFEKLFTGVPISTCQVSVRNLPIGHYYMQIITDKNSYFVNDFMKFE